MTALTRPFLLSKVVAFTRPLLFVSFMITLFSRVMVMFGVMTDGDCLVFLDWRNGEALLETHKKRIYKQLTLAMITFRFGRHIMKRSFVSFVLFSIFAIRCLTIQAKLLRMARSLRKAHSPLVVTACVIVSAVFSYIKLFIELVLAAYHLMVVCKNPSLKEMVTLALGVLRLLELK